MKPAIQQALGVDRIPFESQLKQSDIQTELFGSEKTEIRDNIQRWHSVEKDNKVEMLNNNH